MQRVIVCLKLQKSSVVVGGRILLSLAILSFKVILTVHGHFVLMYLGACKAKITFSQLPLYVHLYFLHSSSQKC